MYVKYGSYQHASNAASVLFEALPLRSRMRGRRYAIRYRMTVQGELLACDGDLDTQIDDLITAYSTDRQTLGLYHDNGTATRHLLDASHASLVDGPYVVRRSWPRGTAGGEYASHHTYMVTMEAIYDFPESGDATSAIIEYTERIEYKGGGGPRWVGQYDQLGVWRSQTIVANTPVVTIQSGRSVGWGGYVSPIAAIAPGYLQSERSWDRKTSPRLGTANTKEYLWEWAYVMLVPTYLGTAPNYK